MPLFINNDKKTFFIHIPKCGGTSIEKSLKDRTNTIYLHNRFTGPVLPCPPQHLNRVWIQSLFYGGINDISYFAVVRHPLLRIVSEFFYAHRNKNKLPSIESWLESTFKEARKNIYARGNHIRCQVDFLVEEARVFYFENGLSNALQHAYSELGIDEKVIEVPHEKQVKKFDLKLTPRSLELVNDFYKKDFEFFGYKKITSSEVLSLSEIKNMSLVASVDDSFIVSDRIATSNPLIEEHGITNVEKPTTIKMKLKKSLRKRLTRLICNYLI